jgi:zinc protease
MAAARSNACYVPVLLLGLGCARVVSVPDRPILPDQAFPQQLLQFESGLRVLIQEDHGSPLVAVATVVRAGTVTDPPGQEGLAHLIEHLAYRKVDDGLKRLGATYNATTEPERTTYFALAHRDQLAPLIALEGMRLARPLEGVTPEVLDVERDVVRNEMRQRGGDPYILGKIFRIAFPNGHPMSRVPEPGAAPLAAITLESAQQFVGQHYQPWNTTVVIAGDVDARKVAQLVAAWGPDVTGTPGRRSPAGARARVPTDAAVSWSTANELHRITRPVIGRGLVIAWPGPPSDHDGHPFLLASLQALMVKVASGSWKTAMRAEPRLLVSSAGSLFSIEIPLKPDEDATKVRDRILDDVANLRGDAMALLLMGPLKWGTAAQLMRGSADLLSSSVALAHYLAATGRPSYYRDTLQQLAEVKPLDVTDFLEKVLSRDRAVALLVEPAVASGEEGETRPALVSVASPPRHELAEDEAVNLAGMGTAELLRVVRSPGLARLPRFRLANGLSVVVVARPRGTPVAAVTVQLPFGDADLTPFGLASLADSLSEGDCEEASLLSQVGGTVDSRLGRSAHRYSAEVFAGNLANGLAALGNSLRCRTLVTNASSSLERRRMASPAGERFLLPSQEAALTFWEQLYPDGADGTREREGQPLSALWEPDVEAAMRAQFAPSRSLAVVVTDVAPQALAPLMERHLGRWQDQPGRPVRRRPRAVPHAPARRVRVFAARRSQATVRFGCRLPPATEETLPAYDLLERIVEREANHVRRSWGATYGFGVEVVYGARGVAHLEVKGSIEPSRTADAITRLLDFVRQLATSGPDIKAFTIERWNLGREFNQRFATAAGAAEGVLSAAAQGWSAHVWDRYPEHLAHLSRGSVRDLLRTCAGHEVVTVLGDPEALTPELAARGLTSP